MAFSLTSPAFENGKSIPIRFSGEGADISPEFRWSDPPPTAVEFALLCDDPDAPTADPWIHWLIYQIDGKARRLPEGVPKARELPQVAGAVQGKNSWGKVGYGGPMPPPGDGKHHYNFTLYALDEPLNLRPEATKVELLVAMKGHIVGEAKMTGLYERP